MRRRKMDKRGKKERKGMNKKGTEMATSMIVTTIIALVLLIILIAMLTGSFKTFKEKVSAYFSISNVDTVIEGCNNLVQTEQNFDYCCVNKTVRFSSKDRIEITCFEAASGNQTWAAGRINNLDCKGVC